MADTEESVCESHTCHSGGICHLLSRLDIGLTVVVSSRQVFEYHLERAESKAVGIVGRHYRGNCFKVMAHSVDTRSGGKSARCTHMEIGVDYRHLRQKLIVC